MESRWAESYPWYVTDYVGRHVKFRYSDLDMKNPVPTTEEDQRNVAVLALIQLGPLDWRDVEGVGRATDHPVGGVQYRKYRLD